MFRVVFRRFGAPFLVTLFTLATLPAAAQDENLEELGTETTEAAPAEEAPKRSKASSSLLRAAGALDEIVVTAQKTEEDVQDVPISVTAIGRDTLEFKGIDDVNAVQLFTPNVNLLSTPTFTLVYMRGIGSGFNKGFEQSVATIIDGVFYSRNNYLNDSLLDVDQIEALRGPQGTIMGKNSTSGALNISTGKPQNEWSASFDGTISEYHDGLNLKAYVTGPIIEDKITFRIAGAFQDQGGDVYNTTLDRMENDTYKFAIRSRLSFDVTEAFNITLGGTVSQLDQDGPGHQIRVWTPDVELLYKTFDPKAENDEFNFQNSLDTPGFVRRDTVIADVTARYDFENDMSLVYVAGWSGFKDHVLFDADFGPAPILTQNTLEKYDQMSHELRVESGPGDIEYVAGLYYFDSTIDLESQNDLLKADTVSVIDELLLPDLLGTALAPAIGLLGGLGVVDLLDFPGEALTYQYEQNVMSLAGFGQVTWHATDELTLVLGARYTYEEKEGQKDQQLSGLGVLWPALVSPRVSAFSEDLSRTERNFTPKASIKYNWTDDIMTFFTYAEGFKGGGYNPQSADADEFAYEEESSRTYELGVRSQFFDGAWTLNLTGFYTEFNDFQVVNFVGSRFVVANAEKARSQGIEAEGFMALTENFFLHGTFGWTDGKYISFPDGPCTAENAEGTCDLTNKELGDAIPYNASVNALIDYPLPSGNMHLFASFDAVYQGATFRVVDLDPADKRGALWLFGSHIGIRDADDVWFATIHGFNLTDEDVSAGSSDVPVFAGTHFGGSAPSRFFSMQFRIRY